jgi:hypothetical protein
LSQCTLIFLTMTWFDSLTQLQETCLTTSFFPMAALLLLTLNTTGKICVKHGTHSNLWNPYSIRSRIALITQKQGESPSVRHTSSRLRTPRSLQLDVKLRPLPQPHLRTRTYAQTSIRTQRATQLRGVLARAYSVSIQSLNTFITTTVT